MWREKIRKLMKLNGYTMHTLADSISLSQSMISHIVNGKRTPSFANMEKICKKLHIKMSNLLDDSYNIDQKNNVLYLDKSKVSSRPKK